MPIRGIDTQMLAAKPAELSGGQTRVQKQAELHMQQTANTITKDTENQKDRTVASAKAEGRKVGDQEREQGEGRKREKKESAQDGTGEQKEPYQDPMLSLAVEKGKYAKREQHFIDLTL